MIRRVRPQGPQIGTGLLSIAIPFYRGAEFLRKAIESVLAQDDPNWRLWVVDDRGEPSGVQQLVSSYADSRIRHRANPGTLGMVSNWNLCLDLADTDLVTLLHADDWLLPGYVSLMRGLASGHAGAVAFFCEAVFVDASGGRRFSFPDAVKSLLVPRREDPYVLRGESALRSLVRGDFIICPTLCYRKSVLGERRFDARWKQVQDLDLLARLLGEGEEIVGSRRRHYVYRRHPRSATFLQSESLLRFEEEWRLLDEIAETASERGWYSAGRVARRKTIVVLHLVYRIAGDLSRGRVRGAAEKARFLWRRVGRGRRGGERGPTRIGGGKLPHLLLAIAVALFAANAPPLLQKIRFAYRTRPLIRSDDDLYRSEAVLGGDFAILQHLRRFHAAGTRVSVPYEIPEPRDPSFEMRLQRCWLGLLPDYPISHSARLVIRAPSLVQPGERLLVRGDRLVLLERRPPSGS